jgi:hypothetical protein
MVFHLPLRQTEGFLRSLADLLGLGLPIPDHTTLSRRLKKLDNLRFRRLVTDEPIHLLIDSTGLRIHVGHLRKPPKRRVWRKLHLAVNADTGEILAEDLTNRHTADCARVPKLLNQIDGSLASVAADGAYDAGSVYEAVQGKGDGDRVKVLIPPGRGAQPSSIRSPGLRERNRNIRSMRRLGRREWYTSSGYSRRSLVENAVFRYKSIVGQRMRSRSLGSQRIEVRLACKILNTMTSLGRPDSYRMTWFPRTEGGICTQLLAMHQRPEPATSGEQRKLQKRLIRRGPPHSEPLPAFFAVSVRVSAGFCRFLGHIRDTVNLDQA